MSALKISLSFVLCFALSQNALYAGGASVPIKFGIKKIDQVIKALKRVDSKMATQFEHSANKIVQEGDDIESAIARFNQALGKDSAQARSIEGLLKMTDKQLSELTASDLRSYKLPRLVIHKPQGVSEKLGQSLNEFGIISSSAKSDLAKQLKPLEQRSPLALKTLKNFSYHMNQGLNPIFVANPTYRPSRSTTTLFNTGVEFLRAISKDSSGLLTGKGNLDTEVITTLVDRVSRGISLSTQEQRELITTMKAIIGPSQENVDLKKGINRHFNGDEVKKKNFLIKCKELG